MDCFMCFRFPWIVLNFVVYSECCVMCYRFFWIVFFVVESRELCYVL